MSEKSIRIASRLYDARNAAKTILGDGYAERMAKEREFIMEVMEAHKCEALPAAMAIVTELQKQNPNSGSAQLMILAACVEMIEPTPTPCQTLTK